ncbi:MULTISPECIES: response regulator transcription factor [Herpetosiphon]|uniref:response regulator transcription factor n=1 Tax=Herpetosiphon TaxID=64 RepID=UPI00195BED25|nr:response regulator transcription factor [Herpetosiphon giganteus]MBM7845569.1 DNA-binding NarL/FixJ family response regulator [Herpetosiphon giganteus]
MLANVCLVESTRVLQIMAKTQFRGAEQLLTQFNLSTAISICSTSFQLLQWLEYQPQHYARLILIDQRLADGVGIAELMPQIRSEHFKHRALADDAKIIGWSRDEQAQALFYQAGLDGFISKNRQSHQLIRDIVTVFANQTEQPWLQLT